MDAQDRRSELGRFLKARRARLRPQDVGLPEGRRRRTSGLRREEVAALAGIGVTWYARLEQGRASGISNRAIDALAGALRLTSADRIHLARLTHDSGSIEATAMEVSPALRAAVEMVDTFPAYVLNDRWDLLLNNRAVAAVLGEITTAPDGHPNLLWWLFTSPAARRMYVNWPVNACHVLADFQRSFAHHAGDPRYAELVEALQAASPEFAEWWAAYELRERGEWMKEIDHPLVGRLVLEVLVSIPEGQPELRLLLQAPEPRSTSSDKLAQLLGHCPEAVEPLRPPASAESAAPQSPR